MIIMQTWALLVDAYRDLNSRKLFWLVLILNVVVVAGFATVGVHGNRISIINWVVPMELPFALFIYKWVFAQILVGQWLTWAATVLALISTASIFPDFMAGGSIDLYLSKPIGRLRLFLTKYATGLLFVLLQVTVFTIGGFFVLGWRGNAWEPGLFLAIPIVVLFYSYLFSILVLFGVLTRSTLGSFFLTIIAWFLIFGIAQADAFMLQADRMYAEQAADAQRRLVRTTQEIEMIEQRLAERQSTTAASRPSSFTEIFTGPVDERRLNRLRSERERFKVLARETAPPGWVKTAQPILFALNTLVPKTQDTINLLNRVLFSDHAMQMALEQIPTDGHDPGQGVRRQIHRILQARGAWWIIGSSVGFELVVLSLAAWRFCRRDY